LQLFIDRRFSRAQRARPDRLEDSLGEKALAASFGEEYASYTRSVHRRIG